jgi:hypothetical protein
MNKLTVEQLRDFPDLGKIFEISKLQDKLDAISDKTLIGMSIVMGRATRMPLREIAEGIMIDYYYNPIAMIDVVGIGTIDLIKKIYHNESTD